MKRIEKKREKSKCQKEKKEEEMRGYRGEERGENREE